MLGYLALERLFDLPLRLTHPIAVSLVRLFLGLKQFFLREYLAFQLFILSLKLCLRDLHLRVRRLETLLDGLERLGNRHLVLKLEGHLLHLAANLHQVSVRLDVRFLFLLVASNPDLPGVLLRCNKLLLLLNLIQELLALDFILLLS